MFPTCWHIFLSHPLSRVQYHQLITTVGVVWLLSRVWLFATPWTVAHQPPWSMRFSRQEYWNELPFPSPPPTSQLPKSEPWNQPWLCYYYLLSLTRSYKFHLLKTSCICPLLPSPTATVWPLTFSPSLSASFQDASVLYCFSTETPLVSLHHVQ